MSKLKNLKYYELKMQPYLKSTKITTRQKKYLFLYRSRMINVGKNYGRSNPCPLCKTNELDTQQHLFDCILLKLSSPLLYSMNKLSYNDIFSSDLQKLIKIAKICEEIYQKRKHLLIND